MAVCINQECGLTFTAHRASTRPRSRFESGCRKNGIYGVLSYLMAQRTTELGIRIALGAPREQVLKLMLLDGLRPVILGLLLGLVISAIATRVSTSMLSILYGTKPLDPAVFGAVVLTLLLVAVLACLTPAWRASRLDPIQAIRVE